MSFWSPSPQVNIEAVTWVCVRREGRAQIDRSLGYEPSDVARNLRLYWFERALRLVVSESAIWADSRFQEHVVKQEEDINKLGRKLEIIDCSKYLPFSGPPSNLLLHISEQRLAPLPAPVPAPFPLPCCSCRIIRHSEVWHDKEKDSLLKVGYSPWLN